MAKKEDTHYMTSSKTPRLAYFIHILTFFTILILVGFDSNATSKSCNTNNVASAILFQDSLVGFRGKIVDSLTKASIPFATISFYSGESKIISIVCKEDGSFSSDIKRLGARVKISAIGYQEHTYYLVSHHTNIILLKPDNNTLPNIIVSSKAKKKPNANKIIKNVNAHILQNYGDISFDQRFKFYSTAQNYDTTKNEIIDLVDIYYNKLQKTMLAKKWQQDTILFDVNFFKFIGAESLVAGDIIPSSDILRKGLAIGEKNRKNFEFKLMTQYHDKIHGAVYLVSFKPKQNFNDLYLGGRTLGGGSWTWRYFKGEMLIKQDDFSVVKLKYFWDRPVERLNEGNEILYHSKHWKADRVDKIIFNSINYKYEYNYTKDSVTGKYFVSTIKADCHNSGYQIETHRNVLLHYQFDVTSLGIKNIIE